MPDFRVRGPSGKAYIVKVPEGMGAEYAQAYATQHEMKAFGAAAMGFGTSAPSSPRPNPASTRGPMSPVSPWYLARQSPRPGAPSLPAKSDPARGPYSPIPIKMDRYGRVAGPTPGSEADGPRLLQSLLAGDMPRRQSLGPWWLGASLPGNMDWEFLTDREEFVTRGKVPEHPDHTPVENSGVTIGVGIDLGQQSESKLRDIGVHEEMIGRLQPYLRLQRGTAQKAVKESPLEVSRKEAIDLTSRVVRSGYDQVARMYNKSAQGGLRFESLPKEMQTVIYSVLHQYGAPTRVPSFWSQVTKGQWQDAHDNLMNFGDIYRPRREREAKKLKEGIERVQSEAHDARAKRR